MSAYSHLLAPLDLGFTTLSCRAIMGSMHTRLETLDRAPERIARFYTERAKGGAALIVTGGYSPNGDGLLEPGGPVLDSAAHLGEHIALTRAVHDAGSKMALQILHAGRYATHGASVAPSSQASPINPKAPRRMTDADIQRTIEDYARCAALAREGGYDGVEIMGSEGYLINEFTAPRTNDRDDDWGGSLEARLRFPVEIMKRVRERVGHDFIVIYRISSIDLVEGGLTAAEIIAQAQAIEAAGASIINQGIGWHEARVPTIAQKVPRAVWTFAARRLKDAVRIPVIASNRISTPDVAERILAAGEADLVSMARPWLADPAFIAKTRAGQADEINVCIACNQACLDYIFSGRVASCLVNPKAGREIEFDAAPPARQKRVAVVGGGAAGLACAATAAERGHAVTLFEASNRIGGQLALARNVPGKEEFDETLRYWQRMLAKHGVTVRLNTRADVDALAGFDDVVVATGIGARTPDIAGIDHAKCVSYADILSGKASAGRRVAIIGAGGIGFDVAEFLSSPAAEVAADPKHFLASWGVDAPNNGPGGLTKPVGDAVPREITMLQRKPGRMGRGLGVSTGWILRLMLAQRKVAQVSGVTYRRIDEDGVHITVGTEDKTIPADTVVICAGQEPQDALLGELAARGIVAHVIGGAAKAAELDAMRAIDEGTRLAVAL
ncbi:MAG: NADPH-dependent 2,4-dienoyl-CoA reductase [Hyphomicrobiaceae bacterium]